MSENTRKVVLALDFNNIVYSSYYAKKLINSKGMNVNAIKGFFIKLKILKETFSPDFIVMANDLSRRDTFRRKMYPMYKGNRKKHDKDIMNQMARITEIVALLGFPMLNNKLYEADDVLGMIGKFNEENGMDTVIISSDRDLFQLVTDHTFVMSPRRNELVDRSYMRDQYSLTPKQWIDLKILQGDRSDNIPGIPGIGERTASQLMITYGSIDNIYKHLDEFSPKMKDILIKNEKNIPFIRTLVTIVTDYKKINLNKEMLQMSHCYHDDVIRVLTDLELFSLFNVMYYDLFHENKEEEVYKNGSKIKH